MHYEEVLFFALALLVVACEKPVLDEEIVPMKEANIILHMTQYDQESFGTRAATDITELCSRLNVTIFDSDGTKVKSVAQKEGDAGYGTVALTLAAGTYQLVEHLTLNQGVQGSNLCGCTTENQRVTEM